MNNTDPPAGMTGLPGDVRRARLLAVDDEEVMRMMLQDVLSDEGYDIDAAASGEEAIELLRKHDYDVVITDVRMPGLDGVAVLKAAKKKDPEMDVVVVTGYASVETAVELMKLGAADYITKPFNIDHIRLVVARLLERRDLKRRAGEVEIYREMSRIDPLTGLYNRRHFNDMLVQEFERTKRYETPFSLLLIDIDNFKGYNDTYGHLAGDAALKAIGFLLKKEVRRSDMATRYGGEEFAIILPHTGKRGAQIMADRLLEKVAETNFNPSTDASPAKITVSIGCATYPGDVSTAALGKAELDKAAGMEEIVGAADRNLYRAKANGKNQVWAGVEHQPSRSPA